VIGTSLFLVPLTLVLLLSAHFSGSTNGHQSATPAHTRLLVLPMENLTGEPDLEYLTDGLTEEIIARLGTLNPISLGVMGPATARHLKGSSKSPTQVGNELNAEYVLASNLAGQRNRIRVSVQLTRVSDGVQLWGADYEREDQSPFGIPSEIALAIANDLRIHPEVSAWNEGTKDGQAHEDYLKGVFFWNKRLKEDVLTAIDYFSRAISRDPNYARPYAGLADSYIVLAGHHLPANAAYAKAREYAEKAVLLDENLAEAHTALAYVMYGENWDWSGAEREYRRAIALDPDYAVAHHWYFMYLTAMRRFPEAIMESETALALDPLSQSINNNAGVTYLMARQYDRAIRQLQKGIELDPNNPVAHGYLGEVYVQQGKYTLAIREFQRAQALESERHNYEFALAGADAPSGRMVEANRWAEKLTNYSTTHYTDPMWFVVMYSGFKDRDKTLLSVGAALRAHSCTALDMNADPRLDFVRSDPRFQQTIAAMHLPR
jgi:TolB-like protein/Tfp pilus assembly protein PilF